MTHFSKRFAPLALALLLPFGLHAEGAKSGFDITLSSGKIRFHIHADTQHSINTVTIEPSGFSEANTPVQVTVDGIVTGAWIADLNKDGAPEIYITATSAGSGSYGSLIAYSSNHNKSFTPVSIPKLSEDTTNGAGYMGHDTFQLTDSKLTRTFPVYKKNDPNCCPTGGKRTLEYSLIPGEATWQLKITAAHTAPARPAP